MEFRLVYQGRLPASGSREDKHLLRQAFHAQLAMLWRQKPLSNYPWLIQAEPLDGKPHLARDVGEHRFVPLISEQLRLTAALDITMLCPETAGPVVSQTGDIDNRLKTLFDALRMPHNEGELPGVATPEAGETPFFCVAEDDSLFTKVSVTTDRLLLPTDHPTEVHMIVCVTTQFTEILLGNVDPGTIGSE